MSSTSGEALNLAQMILRIMKEDAFLRGIFAGVKRGSVKSPWQRVTIRPIELRGIRHWQFNFEGQKKNHTNNSGADALPSILDEVLAYGFANIHLTNNHEEIDIRVSKKGKVLVSRSRHQGPSSPASREHNRSKDIPLPEGEADHLLEVMGIMTREGKVRPTMRAKFIQINEFLKLLSHILETTALKSLDRSLQILDCGCGLSYLTLAVHHFLNEKLKIPCRILGVDVNEEVIRKSIERSHQLGQSDIKFACNPIGQMDFRPDIVLALHACDTSTDDAIAQAIRSGARILLCVPCCHHNINEQIRAQGPSEVMRPLLRHGILKQRLADQVTDAFRALILRIMGYRTEVIEFISPEHTARNLMIRAVHGLPNGAKSFLQEYESLCQFWGVRPYLEQALGQVLKDILGEKITPQPRQPRKQGAIAGHKTSENPD